MPNKAVHNEDLMSLKRIEGQVKGIQRMIVARKYCMDIVNQLHAATNALHRVAEKILAKHIEHCVVDAFKGSSEKKKIQKINEVMDILKRLRKFG